MRDDGCGIAAHVLDSGREGHWGLPGMRERAEGIGAGLKLRSRIGAGTEVELTIPGALAFKMNSSVRYRGGFPGSAGKSLKRRQPTESNEDKGMSASSQIEFSVSTITR